jgi:hypothetical protein
LALGFLSAWISLDAAYVNRRIIGLPESDWVFDGGWAVQAKTTYSYDVAAQLEALPGGAAAGNELFDSKQRGG